MFIPKIKIENTRAANYENNGNAADTFKKTQ